MSFTCFEPKGLSSGRSLYIQETNRMLYMHQYKQSWRQNTLLYLQARLYWCKYNVLYHTCKYNHIPEDDPSSSKHVNDKN